MVSRLTRAPLPSGGPTKRVRDILALVLSAAALAFSLAIVGRFTGFTSPWVAILAMFFFLSLVRVARPLILLRLPRSLREVRGWELEGGIYRAAGVAAYGTLLRRTPLRHLNPHVYLTRSAGDYADVCVQAESAEAAHLLAVVLTLPYLIYAGVERWWGVLLLFVVTHVAANIYPVLHLRLVRGRLQQVLNRRRRQR